MQPAFTCSKSTMEKPNQYVKSEQNYQSSAFSFREIRVLNMKFKTSFRNQAFKMVQQ